MSGRVIQRSCNGVFLLSLLVVLYALDLASLPMWWYNVIVCNWAKRQSKVFDRQGCPALPTTTSSVKMPPQASKKKQDMVVSKTHHARQRQATTRKQASWIEANDCRRGGDSIMSNPDVELLVLMLIERHMLSTSETLCLIVDCMKRLKMCPASFLTVRCLDCFWTHSGGCWCGRRVLYYAL